MGLVQILDTGVQWPCGVYQLVHTLLCNLGKDFKVFKIRLLIWKVRTILNSIQYYIKYA